jgi:Na+/melibiose symporter-like transporter
MPSAPENEAARANAGRGMGALALTIFGALWLFNAMQAGGVARLWFAVLWIVAVALVLASIISIRRGRRVLGERPRRGPAVARKFWIVFALEGAAILAAVILFQLWHWDRYIVAAIAIVVGIYFLPLARLFRAPVYYLIGIALILWPAILLGTVHASTRRDVAIACGVAAILWRTALIVLAIPRR